jgi:hypothetical protein
MGSASRISRNHTDFFLRRMEERVSGGDAEVLSRDPPVYLLRNVLSPLEVRELRALGSRRRSVWSHTHPLVCFQHDSYTGHPGLAHHWSRLLGTPGRGARGCLTQEASRVVGAALQASESLFIYRGEEAALEALDAHVEQSAGLHASHAHPWQLLRYRPGEQYADHSDCGGRDGLLEPENRMATVLMYLTDDFEGGETEFPSLNLKIKPPVGTALLFYNYAGGRCATAATTHRSNVVLRGTKEVLQRWYSAPEQPFLAARPFRFAGDRMLPFQPLVVCDWTQSKFTNVSCRWYNSHHAIEPEVLHAEAPGLARVSS